MKMSNNPAKYEILIKKYSCSILNISELVMNSKYKTTLLLEKASKLVLYYALLVSDYILVFVLLI